MSTGKTSFIKELREKILGGYLITKEEALLLDQQPLEELTTGANEIREHFCQNNFDFCVIISGKGGRCSEDCKYCAQSVNAQTEIGTFPLLSTDIILEDAKYIEEKNIKRYSIVTSGRKLNTKEIEKVSQSIKELKSKTNLSLCSSFGLLNKEDLEVIKAAGMGRIHNNLETSRNFFPNICSTHTYEDKISSIKEAQKMGFAICSGGLFGLGESMEDRIDMVFDIRELGIKSIPVNMLNPIPGTPYGDRTPMTIDDICKIIAIFRFIVPYGYIRMAGGRGLLPEQGKKCFISGSNAAISGDFLTTQGITIENDMKMIKELGYIPTLGNC